MKKLNLILTFLLLAISATADAKCFVQGRNGKVFFDDPFTCLSFEGRNCVDFKTAPRGDTIKTSTCRSDASDNSCISDGQTELKCAEVGTLVRAKNGETSCKVKRASKKDYQELSKQGATVSGKTKAQ